MDLAGKAYAPKLLVVMGILFKDILESQTQKAFGVGLCSITYSIL